MNKALLKQTISNPATPLWALAGAAATLAFGLLHESRALDKKRNDVEYDGIEQARKGELWSEIEDFRKKVVEWSESGADFNNRPAIPYRWER